MSAGAAASVVRFGIFELDLVSGELRKSGRLVRLQPHPARVLVLLTTRAGQLVTREEIKEELWGAETFVDFEQGLNFCIRQIRGALGDSAESPRYIQTLPKRGYRFMVAVNGTVNQTRSGKGAPVLPADNSKSRPRAPWMAALLIFLFLTGSIAGYLIYRSARHVRAASGKIMLAVLPFENMSADPEQEFFSEGLTDEVITHLGRLQPGRLGVIARTSTMQYHRTRKPIDKIGGDLGADYILEGGVIREDKRVRINAQLIKVSDQTHLWANSYVFDLRDILKLQNELADKIADEIRLTLNSEQQARLESHRPLDPEAHEAYLKGRYFWNRRTQPGYLEAIKYFQQAIEKDPNYPQPYAGLADALALLGSLPNPPIPRHDAMPRAKTAALRALQLDESLAEAHTSLGFIKMHYDWDWAGAEKQFQRAIQLNPSYATAHHWHAYLLLAMGEPDQAVAEVAEARKVDPLSLVINTDLGEMLAYAGQYDASIQQFRRTLQMEPDFMLAHSGLGITYMLKGQLGESLNELRKASDLPGGKTWVLPALACALAESGQRLKAQELLRQLEAQAVEPDQAAAIYAALGDKDRALTLLEEAYRRHSGSMMLVKVDPSWKNLHSDPRFADLVRRMGLP